MRILKIAVIGSNMVDLISYINKMPVATFEGNSIKMEWIWKILKWMEFFKVHSDLELKVAQIKIMPGLDSELFI